MNTVVKNMMKRIKNVLKGKSNVSQEEAVRESNNLDIKYVIKRKCYESGIKGKHNKP